MFCASLFLSPAFSRDIFLSKLDYILKDSMLAVGIRAGPVATPDPGSWDSGAQALWAWLYSWDEMAQDIAWT